MMAVPSTHKRGRTECPLWCGLARAPQCQAVSIEHASSSALWRVRDEACQRKGTIG